MSISEEASSENLNNLLTQFQPVRLLSSDPSSKTVSILGQIESEPAILSLEKTHFKVSDHDLYPENRIPAKVFDLSSLISNVRVINQNDIYYWALGSVNQDIIKHPSLKINLIWPATEIHIQKYDEQTYHLITETPQIYQKIVKPYIESMKGDRIQWVKNILYHGAEADKVVYNDLDQKNGFILLPDMKWDGVNMDSLYLVALVYTEEISSLRDLRPKHKDWLIKLLIKLREVVPAVYHNKVSSDQLRIFIHYQPSYYHFHIHIVNLKHKGLNDGISAGKAHLLEDVIDQLDFLGEEGFAARNLTYLIGENHGLWKAGLKEYQEKVLKEIGMSD